MSSNNTESAKNNQTDDHGDAQTSLLDLESKVMQVGTQKYYIDMKQSQRSRFFKIVEVLPGYKRSRLVVPMTVAKQFCEKLQEIDKYASNYDSSKRSRDTRSGDAIHSLTLECPGTRTYMFDLYHTNQYLNLRIGYKYMDKHDFVFMVTDAIVEILNILNGFIQRYEPLPGQEEEDAQVRYPQRRNFQRRRRFDDAPRGMGRQANGRQPRDNNLPPRNRPRQQNPPLVVLGDPSPSAINLNQKGYTFEVVQGTHVFLRITESINGTKRSTMHIPAEACAEFRDLIDKFASSAKITEQVTQAQSAAAAQPVTN